jgi:hypothetical protein
MEEASETLINRPALPDKPQKTHEMVYLKDDISTRFYFRRHLGAHVRDSRRMRVEHGEYFSNVSHFDIASCRG